MQRPTRIDDFDVPVWWDCVWRRVPCGADMCRFCGRMNTQRKKHVERGEDPDSIEAVMEDVKENFSDVRLMLLRDAERMDIDLSELPDKDDEDDFDAMTHPRTERALAWLKRVHALAQADDGGGFWRATEAAADLFWYANTFVVKTARDIDNLRALEQGEDMARVDFVYTRYVLSAVFFILDTALTILESAVHDHGKVFAALRADLLSMTEAMNLSQAHLFSNSREPRTRAKLGTGQVSE